MPRNHKCKAKGCNNIVDRTYRSTAQVCSGLCALALVREKEANKRSKEHREDKRRLKDNDRSFQIKKTQKIFNSYIRQRDNALPCISCDRHHRGQYHCGHYLTVGSNPELRFDERNCHKQCSPCNNHLSGNIANYRKGLISKLGPEVVEYLEGPHELKRYTIDDLKLIQEKYKAKIKLLENSYGESS